MAGSFVENVNLLASKVAVVEEANSIFDEGVIPILEEIALLDLDEAILDLKKGNYLGNRKIDINLALNIQGISQELIDKEPEQAEAIWTKPSNTVLYNKATATFVDGTVIELPFLFDGNPVTISTHGDLLAQLSRLDYTYAQAQVDSLYQVTVGDNTDYIITIDNVAYTYTSGVDATRESIIAGIANMINAEAIPITANVTDLGTKLNLTADIAGNPFYAEVSSNMAITTITSNIIEGPKETKFLAKLTGTLAANFASPVVGEIVKLYDIIGQNSNLESLQLHAISGRYIEKAPLYYWAKTTSAFQTLSMRANDIIKLGSEIDKIIKLASSIDEVIELQNHLPQLVDTFDINGNPNGDQTIYNALTELKELHSKLTEIITVYNDMKIGGNNYIQSVANDLQTTNTIGVVAEDLNLGLNSTVKNTGSNITSVVIVSDNISSVNNVNDNIVPIIEVADTIIPNLNEILQADDNANIATTKAQEAANSALLASQKNSEIKSVSVGSTVTGAPGTNASVVYNPANGKFTFVVPQGIKGDRGDAFQVNSMGTISQRALYDNQFTGFSFLAVDVDVSGSTIPHIYFKKSSASGDWSIGIPFGRGDKGDTGDKGNGILQIVFTGTSHISGLSAQSGGDDEYTITYTDGTTNTFIVHNGIDSDINTTSVSTLTNKTLDDMTNIIGANHVHYKVRNSTGTVILKGTVVKASSTQTGTGYIEVEPTSSSTDIGLGIVTSVISASTNWEGLIVVKGEVNNINTNMWDVGTKLYTSSSGAFTNIKPTTNTYQVCGYVHTKHSTLGTIAVDFTDPIENTDNIVHRDGDENIDGTKTFSLAIIGNITGNAGSVTNGVYTTGDQTIAGVKTFISSPIVPTPTTNTQAANKAYVDANLSSYIPRGLISLWSGSIASIPSGWALCNGTNGTPDLRDRFVVGAGSTYDVGVTGGSKDAVVVGHTHTQASHTHTASTNSTGAHTHTVPTVNDHAGGSLRGIQGTFGGTNHGTKATSSSGAHSHTVTVGDETPVINSTGVSGTNANLPPYYALAYIMKI